MCQQKTIFDTALRRARYIWKYTGMQINYYEENSTKKTLLGHLRKRWFYIGNFIWLTAGALSVFGKMRHLNIQEVLYIIPCMVFAFLGGIKSFYFLYYEDMVMETIKTLRILHSDSDYSEGINTAKSVMLRKHLPFLNAANNVLIVMCYSLVVTFGVGPLAILIWQYWSTGKIVLFLPYAIWYPFDEYSYSGWPLALFHQLWSAWTAVFFVCGTDCFFYTACTFVHNQFCCLQFDMIRIGPDCSTNKHYFDTHIGSLLHRHKLLMRCINLLNTIYGKSTLFNVVSSSFIICLAGFNITAIDELLLMVPFIAFILYGSIQIFLLCYYGDLLMCASMETSNAIYTSEWYKLNASSMKCCLFIIMRAQKPCRITATGFADINLRTFTKILSTASSYFTIIHTMYSK